MITTTFPFREIISMFIKAKSFNKHFKNHKFVSNTIIIKHGFVTLTIILKFINKL